MFNLEDYEDVATLNKWFQDNYPMGRIRVEVLSEDPKDERMTIWAAIYRDSNDANPAVENIARGRQSDYNRNMARFYAEDLATSAIGRCIALLKGTKTATKDDMKKVNDHPITQVKAKISEAKHEPYVPVVNEEDPWTIKAVSPAQPAADAVELVKEILGGEEVKPQAPDCKCGKPMEWRTGTSKAGKPWAHFTCTNVPSRKCQEPIWYVISSDGTWKPQVN